MIVVDAGGKEVEGTELSFSERVGGVDSAEEGGHLAKAATGLAPGGKVKTRCTARQWPLRRRDGAPPDPKAGSTSSAR